MTTYYIGCDLGGTNLRAGIVNSETGQVSHLASIPTLAREGHDAVMVRMGELFQAVIVSSGLPRSEFGGIGIGVPGMLDLERGMVLFLPNLPGTWPNVPLGDTIQAITGLPVCLLNDVRAITNGEYRFGAGQGVENMACFAIGTGVGGGLVLGGRLHLALGGTAGELGHISIDLNGPVCGCGNRGCVETYASGPAITALGIKAVVQGLTTCIGELVAYDLNRITPEVVAQAALAGDPIARDIWEQAGTALGVAVVNVCVAFGPRKVVISGGVSRAGELLLDPIRRTLRERMRVVPADQIQVVPALLGNNAGVIGAAMWTKEVVG